MTNMNTTNVTSLDDIKLARELRELDAMERGLSSPLAMGPVNDDRSIAFCNGVISVCAIALGGEWIVSVFFCGADGQADTENGEHQITKCASRDEALRLFDAWRVVAGQKCFRVARRRVLGL